MFLRVFKDFMETKRGSPDFRPARPVVAGFVRPPLGIENAALITDQFTAKVADLFNASYGMAIHLLSRFYVHEEGRAEELQALVDTAVGTMEEVLEPLGKALTTLPMGSRLPGVNAGPSFELQSREYILPHRTQAFMVLQERLLELSEDATSLSGQAPSHEAAAQLKKIGKSLSKLAAGLAVESLNS
jgi:hypothetical protein